MGRTWLAVGARRGWGRAVACGAGSGKDACRAGWCKAQQRETWGNQSQSVTATAGYINTSINKKGISPVPEALRHVHHGHRACTSFGGQRLRAA